MMTTSDTEPVGYTLTNTWDQARERLEAGAGWLDPWTTDALERIGVGEGWACLEIGGGNGSIAEWLCSRAGAGGRVVATDLEPHFLLELRHPNLTALRHDVAADELTEGQFDLVHARLVLSHLPERDAVLAKLVRALKPGGWILVEDVDQATAGLADPASDPALVAALDKIASNARATAWQQLAGAPTSTAMGDINHGRRLYGAMRRHRLERIVVEGHCSMVPGGSRYAHFMALTYRQVRGILLDLGLTDPEVDTAIAALEDPRLVVLSQLLISARGQRSTAG
jgi:ubiquinone/menaquinone biosynthesis C-methylase UbiE